MNTETPFQIGAHILRTLDLDLRNERRLTDRRSVQDMLNEAHSAWQNDRRISARRFDDRFPIDLAKFVESRT